MKKIQEEDKTSAVKRVNISLDVGREQKMAELVPLYLDEGWEGWG